MKKMVLLLALCIGLPGLVSPAMAKSVGRDLHKVAECQTLSGNTQLGDRAQCIACVQREEKHHYNISYPAGTRCRPDVIKSSSD